jgi:hypothetical protein
MQPDVNISSLQIRLQPGQGRAPLEPVVERLSVDLSSEAFRKIVEQAVRMFANRLPLDVDLGTVQLIAGGAEIVTRVKRSILKADLRVRLGFSVHDGHAFRIRVSDLDAPAWVPTQLVLDQGVNYATTREGFSRVDGDNRAIDVNPEVILAATGLPMTLAQPGSWQIAPVAGSVNVSYSST